jgi:hypothetical protein
MSLLLLWWIYELEGGCVKPPGAWAELALRDCVGVVDEVKEE